MTAPARHRNFSAKTTYERVALPLDAQRAETRYLQGQQEYDKRMGNAVVQAANWRRNGMFLMFLIGGSLAGNVYQARMPKLVPHVIEVDALGDVAYRGPAGDPAAAFTPSESLIRYQLRRWIELTRTVSTDRQLMKRNWITVYSMLDEVTGKPPMTKWWHEHDPIVRSQEETATIEILSAVPLSGQSWQIDWRETTWDKFGAPREKPQIWRAILKVSLVPPTTREQMIANPLGLFVDEFHWDRVQTAKQL